MKAETEQKTKIQIRKTSILNELINELKLKTNILSIMATTIIVTNHSQSLDLE